MWLGWIYNSLELQFYKRLCSILLKIGRYPTWALGNGFIPLHSVRAKCTFLQQGQSAFNFASEPVLCVFLGFNIICKFTYIFVNAEFSNGSHNCIMFKNKIYGVR